MPRRKDHRLDLLIYAHDGRGLGHASRGIAIGIAFRRIFPNRKVLFVSGSKHTATLVGPASLDWIKLPSYNTVLVNGNAHGRIGHTNLDNVYLGESRSRLMRTIVSEYRPRCVLVDHEPQGKRRELLAALELKTDTAWVLGMRGIIGNVAGIWSPAAVERFHQYYRSLLWYGDTRVLGSEPLEAIENHYRVRPRMTGYVSRLKEMRHWFEPPASQKPFAGTIAVSWHSDASLNVLKQIRKALGIIGPQFGEWRLFANAGRSFFKDLPFCRVQDLSPGYLSSLVNSKIALIYGGYNSLMDILSINIPAVVMLRTVDDQEKDVHTARLAAVPGTSLTVLDEKNIDAEILKTALLRQLNARPASTPAIDINGAENAARILAEYNPT